MLVQCRHEGALFGQPVLARSHCGRSSAVGCRKTLRGTQKAAASPGSRNDRRRIHHTLFVYSSDSCTGRKSGMSPVDAANSIRRREKAVAAGAGVSVSQCSIRRHCGSRDPCSWTSDGKSACFLFGDQHGRMRTAVSIFRNQGRTMPSASGRRRRGGDLERTSGHGRSADGSFQRETRCDRI